jgi:hypothetical protein
MFNFMASKNDHSSRIHLSILHLGLCHHRKSTVQSATYAVYFTYFR